MAQANWLGPKLDSIDNMTNSYSIGKRCPTTNCINSPEYNENILKKTTAVSKTSVIINKDLFSRIYIVYTNILLP